MSSFAESPMESERQLPAGGQSLPPSIQVSVAVVDADQSVRNRLAMQIGQGATAFASIEELSRRLTGTTPVVVVLGPSCSGAAELAVAERLMGAHPELGAILIADELSTAVLQQALRAGVRDVVSMPIETSQLTQAVQKVAVGLEVSPRQPQVAANLEADPGGPEETGELGRVITVFSTKGGAGKSVISTNLAAILAQRSDRPVCLIDADLQFGDVAVMLKLTPQHTIVDAVNSIEKLDLALMDSLLVEHEPSGLKVLPAPLEPAFADQIGARDVVAIVEVLRRFCAVVVVDTPAYFNDVVLGLVEASDEVLLVAGMDIPNIKNVKIGLQTLRLLNTPMEKLKLILNRANSKVKLDVTEVERTLQVKADGLIPSDVVVPQAVNKGVPVVLHAPKSAVTRAIETLADEIIPVDGKKRKRK